MTMALDRSGSALWPTWRLCAVGMMLVGLVGLALIAALIVAGVLLYRQMTSKVDVAMVTDDASAQKVLGVLASAQISADVHRDEGGATLAIRVRGRDEDRARSALRSHAIS